MSAAARDARVPALLVLPGMDEFGDPTEWAAAIDQFITSLGAAGQSRATLRLRRHQVARLARFVDVGPWDVTQGDLEAYLSQPGWKPETRYSARSGLRTFYAWAKRTDRIERDPAQRLARVRRGEAHARAVPDGSMMAALAVASEREALMIRLAGEHGLRRGEIAQVHRDHLEPDLFGHSLLVQGKGGKVRRVPLADDVAAAILACEGYVFPGKIDGHLSPDRVGRIIKDLLPPAYSAHKLRHRFATVAYAVDHDVFAVQALLGHSSPATTLRYVQLPNDAARRLVDAVAIR